MSTPRPWENLNGKPYVPAWKRMGIKLTKPPDPFYCSKVATAPGLHDNYFYKHYYCPNPPDLEERIRAHQNPHVGAEVDATKDADSTKSEETLEEENVLGFLDDQVKKAPDPKNDWVDRLSHYQKRPSKVDKEAPTADVRSKKPISSPESSSKLPRKSGTTKDGPDFDSDKKQKGTRTRKSEKRLKKKHAERKKDHGGPKDSQPSHNPEENRIPKITELEKESRKDTKEPEILDQQNESQTSELRDRRKHKSRKRDHIVSDPSEMESSTSVNYDQDRTQGAITEEEGKCVRRDRKRRRREKQKGLDDDDHPTHRALDVPQHSKSSDEMKVDREDRNSSASKKKHHSKHRKRDSL